MPGMCLAVVAVVAMLVVGRGSAMARVEEAATAAVEEATMCGVGGAGLRVYLTWRNRRLPSPTRINLFLCQSFCLSVRTKRGIWTKRVLIRKIGNFSFSVR
jgi:hypothetical protein